LKLDALIIDACINKLVINKEQGILYRK